VVRHLLPACSGGTFIKPECRHFAHLNTLPGLYYPTSGRKGIAHHEFANAISHQVAKTAALQDTLLQSTVVSDMRAEIDAQSDDVLISSEALQNTSPRFVARIFQGYRIRTLVYIRNQVDYLASSYAQKVWATDYADTMESFYRSIFGGNYQQFLTAWQSISDAGMKVRLFERGALSHGDIVADFYEQMLEINDPATIQAILDRETIDSNPSLTADLLAFKLRCSHDIRTESTMCRCLPRQQPAGCRRLLPGYCPV